MALFKTIEEFRAFVPVATNLNLEDIKPHLEFAESKMIAQIGAEQFAELKTAYEAAPSADALTANLKNLLPYVQRPLANYGMEIAIPHLSVTIDGSGVRIYSSDTQKTAFAWQIDKVANGYVKAGDNAMDLLLDYLETNKATYTTWANSSAYTVFKECFITTTAIFNKYRNINNSRRVFMALRSTMLEVQDHSILPLLDTAFYEEILAEVETGNISADNEPVLKMIQKAIVYLTLAKGLSEYSIVVDAQGVYQIGTALGEMFQQKNSVSQSLISSMSDELEETGETYLKQLAKFLNENASSSLYVNYFNGNQYVNPDDEATYTNDSTNHVGLF